MRKNIKKPYAKMTKKEKKGMENWTPAEKKERLQWQIADFISEELEILDLHKQPCGCTHCRAHHNSLKDKNIGHKVFCDCIICQIYRQRIRMLNKRPINRFKR